jgi:UDP:flavonoid glycosyltransferase YjiC (YdhE family)
MRVLAAVSLGGAGHLGPLRPFLDAARRAGHATAVVAPPAMEEMVQSAGHPFVRGGEPPESDVAPIRERLPVASAIEASRLGNRELFGRLATTAMLPSMADAVRTWRPDLLLRDPCEYASAVVAGTEGVPVVQVAISLADAEWGSIAMAEPALEAHHAGLTDLVRETPYWTRFPTALDPSPFPTTVRTRESIEPEPARPALPRWWGDDDRRLVYVTFGTVLGHMTSAASVFGVVLAAVAELDARVLLTVGRTFDPRQLGAVPPHVHVEPWADQGDVLAEADAVVGHGGSGTTLGALAAGVPMVLVPQFADQFANTERVVAAGAGVAVTIGTGHDGGRRPLTLADAPRIRAAIDEVLDGDGRHALAARRIAEAMADVPTPAEILDRTLADLPTD